ncbi:MAG: DUF2203 domain-containing protein [Planctomycetaceae bacterium]|nr:DUF2203 domain-containing protein [Planctomycetaceae bacterium]
MASANRTLPLVRAIVQDLVTLNRDVHERQRVLRGLGKSRQNDSSMPDPYAEEVQESRRILRADELRMKDFVRELSELGVALHDADVGAVKFPCVIEGNPACYSWQPGEASIIYWLGPDDGLSERRPLPAVELEPPRGGGYDAGLQSKA